MINKDNNTKIYNDVKKYLAYLQFERKLSSNTITSYWLDLKSFMEYMIDCYSIKKISDIKSDNIKKYITSLNFYKSENNKIKSKESSSINRSISSIKNFYKYLNNNEFIDFDPSKVISSSKQIKKLPDILSIEEINQILNSFDLNKINKVRDKTIISLLYSCGLRVTELTSLRLTNLFLEEDIIRIFGKGNKERIVPIGRIAKDDIIFYINNVRPKYARKFNSKGFLFMSNRGKELSRKTVWNIIKISTIEANITKKVSPHTFRHSFASHLLEGGAGLRIVQELLGHTNISTTQIYTQLDQTYLKEIHKEFHPRG